MAFLVSSGWVGDREHERNRDGHGGMAQLG
jgi:hypothetical protein